MGEMLQADIDELRALGKKLTRNADSIGGIKHTATVTMPGSPVAEAAEQCSIAAVAAYQFVGRNISGMADAARTSATTYEAVDHAFAAQLKRYLAGDGVG